jgi:hypothetical protein
MGKTCYIISLFPSSYNLNLSISLFISLQYTNFDISVKKLLFIFFIKFIEGSHKY